MSLLFSPLRLGGLELSNRVVVSPMCQYAAKDGNATDWHLMHLGNFAVSGSGLVITEAAAVEPEGRISLQCLGLYSDENEQALQRIVDFFRQYAGYTKLGIQLGHAGRKGSVLPSFMVRQAVAIEDGGWMPASPSLYTDEVHATPRVLAVAEIHKITAAWQDAVRRAARVGMELLELHFGHGYLINQFLSPLINSRTDQYGGARDNRMRFALEVFQACRSVWPEDKPIGVRISAVDWVEGGWDIEDSVALSYELKQRGCDFICATSGGVSLRQKITPAPLYQVPFAERIRREVGIPTIAVGQIWEARDAEDVLRRGQADLIALARRMLYDPRWAWHAAAEFNEFIPYPPRYKSCNPIMATASVFAETREKKRALLAVDAAEADFAKRLAPKQ